MHYFYFWAFAPAHAYPSTDILIILYESNKFVCLWKNGKKAVGGRRCLSSDYDGNYVERKGSASRWDTWKKQGKPFQSQIKITPARHSLVWEPTLVALNVSYPNSRSWWYRNILEKEKFMTHIEISHRHDRQCAYSRAWALLNRRNLQSNVHRFRLYKKKGSCQQKSRHLTESKKMVQWFRYILNWLIWQRNMMGRMCLGEKSGVGDMSMWYSSWTQ